jgi:hypothetical protein
VPARLFSFMLADRCYFIFIFRPGGSEDCTITLHSVVLSFFAKCENEGEGVLLVLSNGIKTWVSRPGLST